MKTLYEARSGFDEVEVLRALPPALSKNLLDYMYRDQIKNVPVFRALPHDALTMMCLRLKPYKAMRGDPIYNDGEIGREMFIIISGAVKLETEVGLGRIVALHYRSSTLYKTH